MLGRSRPAGLVALVALMLSLVLTGTVGASSAAAPVAVASGLSGTFFLTVGDDGALYAYDGGAGNTETLPPPAGAPEDTPPLTRGLTGSIIRIAPNGAKTTVASGLPSYGGSGATGLVVANGFVWLIVSPSPAAAYGATPYPTEGYLVKIALSNGVVTQVANLAGYEVANNPDGTDVNPNPWGLVLGTDGNLYATDAGGNSLLRVNPTTGEISLVTTFAPIPGTEPNPELDNRNEVQAVPTGIALAPGGGFFVTYLPGELGTPPPGSGRVVRVAANGTVSQYATGFNFAVNLAVGPDNNVYVVELIGGFGQQGPLPGRVSRVLANGTKEVVADGLEFPGGIAFDRAGNLFVATGVTSFGPPPPTPAGQILRFDGVARPATPSPSPSTVPSPPPTGNGGNLPGLPSTGAGGAASTSLPLLPILGVTAALGGLLALRRARTNRAR
jgi:sugar lactone lactonase YvrE